MQRPSHVPCPRCQSPATWQDDVVAYVCIFCGEAVPLLPERWLRELRAACRAGRDREDR